MSWGPPQGPQGYPPPGYGQQPQQPPQMPYGYPPQQRPYAPPKKGLGVGAILAIVFGVLALLAVIGGGVLYVVFRDSDGSSSSSSTSSSSPSTASSDQSAALETKANALLAAVKTRDSTKVEDPLLEFAVTPETAKTWFTATFDAKTAEDLYGYWDRQVFPNITDLVTPFKTAIAHDATEVRVTRFASAEDVTACKNDFCKYRENGNLTKLFGAMTKPQALYLVQLAKPGSAPGDDDQEVFFFAVIKGSFAYLGSLQM